MPDNNDSDQEKKPTPNEVFRRAADFRDAVHDRDDNVRREINSQASNKDEEHDLEGIWGGLLNATDREVSRAATLILQAAHSKREKAADGIKDADKEFGDAMKDLNDIAKALKAAAGAVKIFGDAIKLLALTGSP